MFSSPSDNEEAFSRYNNIFWARVSLRNSRKAGYTKPVMSSAAVEGYTRRYSRNSSRRKSRRDRRPDGHSYGQPNSQPGGRSDSHPHGHPDNRPYGRLDSHPVGHPEIHRVGDPDSRPTAPSNNCHKGLITQVSCDLEGDVFLGEPAVVRVETFDADSRHTVSVTSKTFYSSVSILPNPYNDFNHSIHTMLMSPCCIVFFFICCMPAVHYMERSDERFQCGEKDVAERYARRSTLLFILGFTITLVLSALVLFLIIFFTVR